MSDASKAIAHHRKLENEFFLGQNVEKKTSNRKIKKTKSNKHQDEIEILDSTSEEKQIPENNKGTKLIASEFFNGIVVNTQNLISERRINRTNDYGKSRDLFINENERMEQSSVGRKPEEEGHSITTYSGNNTLVMQVLNKFKTSWYCFDIDNIFSTESFICDESDDLDSKILTEFVPSQDFKNKTNGNVCKNIVVEIDFDCLKFTHHSLFSIEQVFEKQLITMHNLIVNLAKDIKDMQNTSEELQNRKRDILQSITSPKRENKKIYNNKEFCECVNEIKKNNTLYYQKCIEERKTEKNIILLWKNIKYIRKKLGINNTGVTLTVRKIDMEIDDANKIWEESIDLEMNNVIDELKCEYYQKKKKYNEQTKKLKQSSTNDKSFKKPILDVDEDKLRERIEKKLSQALRQPQDPILSFDIKSVSKDIIGTPKETDEINRRSDINKTKMFIKIYVNHREVCKTNTFQLEQNFTINISEKYTIHLNENIFSLKIMVFEKLSILPSHLCYEIIVPIEKSTEKSVYDFKNEMSKFHNHSGVGSGSSMSNLILKKYPKLEIPDIQHDKILINEGELHMQLKIITKSAENTPNSNKIEKVNSKLDMKTLLGNSLDPNDPENTQISHYFENDTKGFYLNSHMYMDFERKVRYGKSIQESLTSIKNRVGDQLLSPKRDQLSILSGGKNSLKIATPKSVNAIDTINIHRKNSVKKLQSINNYIFQHIKDEKEKKLSDILTDIHYPSIKTLTVNVLDPKTPLFNQSRQSSPTVQEQKNESKDYLLKICIFKAFHLPNRLENESQSPQNTNEEGLLKMVNLRPYIYVNCQGQTRRTSTVIGNSPTWNEQMTFSIKHNPLTTISFHLCDEIVENMLIDDRLEESTLHYQFSAHWLASLKIPLVNVISQNKVEGTFLMQCPMELLGYKFNLDEKYPASHVSYDSLRKEPSPKQKEEIFLSMYLEIFPNYRETPQIQLYKKLNSNEIDLMLQHLNCFSETYLAQFPNRKLNVLVIDSGGKNICISRFFQPIPMFQFNECLKAIFETTPRDNSSSKSSSFRKKLLKTEEMPRTIQSMLSTNLNIKRQSIPTKESFEMKTIDDSSITDELTLAMKMQICIRFVAMIPLHNTQLMHNQFVVLSAAEVLKLSYGTMIDHTILLMGYFMELGIECWCVAGYGLPRGYSTYILAKENITTNEIILKSNFKSVAKSKSWRNVIFDATSGKKFDVKDPFCPLQKVHFICNNENIWANIQIEERCSLIRYNLKNTSDWRPVFQKDSLVSCPGPLPNTTSEASIDSPLYTYDEGIVHQLRDMLEDKIIHKIQKWRAHRKTTWNRYCGKILRDSLAVWEKWCLNTAMIRPKYSSQLQQLMLAYEIYGFPLNLSYTTIGDIVSTVKGTQLHLNEHSDVEFALGVEIFSYPNFVYSVWIYLASIIKK